MLGLHLIGCLKLAMKLVGALEPVAEHALNAGDQFGWWLMANRSLPCAGPFIVWNEANEVAVLRRWFDHMREVGHRAATLCLLAALPSAAVFEWHCARETVWWSQSLTARTKACFQPVA